MQNQNIENLGNDTDMIEQFKKFISMQKQQEPLHPEEKTLTRKPKITVQKMKPQQQQPAQPPRPPPPADESDDEIEYKPQKPKRQLSEKQMENLIKGREKRDALRKQRLEEKTKQNEEYKKVVEEKIVKKAIQIKKKKLKQEKLIEPEPESDDETLIKNTPKKPALAHNVARLQTPSDYPVNPHKPQHPPPSSQGHQRKFYFV
jgi:hypothetical protein